MPQYARIQNNFPSDFLFQSCSFSLFFYLLFPKRLIYFSVQRKGQYFLVFSFELKQSKKRVRPDEMCTEF